MRARAPHPQIGGDDHEFAIAAHDVPYLAQRTNPYLLRYYFFATGMKDDEFIRKLNRG